MHTRMHTFIPQIFLSVSSVLDILEDVLVFWTRSLTFQAHFNLPLKALQMWSNKANLWGLPRWLNGKVSASQCRTRVQSLGWEDPLEEEMATYSSILAWKIP